MTWSYQFSRVNHRGSPAICAEMCGTPAHYRLTAVNAEQIAHREMCVNHSASSAHKLGLRFPPTNTEIAK